MERLGTVILAAFAGGFVQAVTGFGGAIIIMIFLPFLFTMTEAPAVSDMITMMLSFSMFFQYRKSVNRRNLLVPAAIYLAASTAAIHLSARLDTGKLKLIFGVFLVVLSCYFFFFSEKVRLRPGICTGLCCGGAAGICGGLFGISGPPISLYYLAVSREKEEYLGTLNAFFSITVIFNMITRIQQGFLTPSLLLPIGVGIVAILAGCAWGSRAAKRMELSMMKRCVCVLMAFAGLISLIQGFLS